MSSGERSKFVAAVAAVAAGGVDLTCGLVVCLGVDGLTSCLSCV